MFYVNIISIKPEKNIFTLDSQSIILHDKEIPILTSTSLEN